MNMNKTAYLSGREIVVEVQYLGNPSEAVTCCNKSGSCYCSVGVTPGPRAEGSGVQFSAYVRFFFEKVKTGPGAHPASQVVKRLWLEVDNSRSHSSEVQNEWSCTSSPPIHLHGVHWTTRFYLNESYISMCVILCSSVLSFGISVSTLSVEALCSSETVIRNETTWRHVTERRAAQ
jgi:hypothetical protein